MLIGQSSRKARLRDPDAVSLQIRAPNQALMQMPEDKKCQIRKATEHRRIASRE